MIDRLRPRERLAVVELAGGLGNQLFQYAAARALCAREARRLYFAWYSARRTTARRFMLDVYPLPEGVEPSPLDGRTLRRLGLRAPLTHRKTGTLYALVRGGLVRLRESGFAYAPLSSVFRRVALDGYFQSWRYFEDRSEEIRTTFSPRRPASGKNAELLRRMCGENAICLHVRRGDYVQDPTTAAVHGAQTLDYYRRAIEALGDFGRSGTFYVFSDDPTWTRAHIQTSGEAIYVDHNSVDEPWEDLRLMAACRHFVIANSSFSWWGAWLGAHPDKRVVAPARWFAGSDADTRDLCPPNWLRL